MQLCISQATKSVNETKSTLDFGQRALKVKTKPRVNVEVCFYWFGIYLDAGYYFRGPQADVKWIWFQSYSHSKLSWLTSILKLD